MCADPDDAIYQKLGLAAVPAVLVYDKTGEMRKRFDNETEQYGRESFKYDHNVLLGFLLGNIPYDVVRREPA